MQKRKYRSKEEAEKVAEQSKEEGRAVRVYPCEEGDGWHLTSRNAPPPARAINDLTLVERRHYTKKTKNTLGESLDKDLMLQLKDEAQNNTLVILERKIEQAKQELDKKTRVYKSHRKDLAELRKKMELAEQDCERAMRDLRVVQTEYNSAKSRIKIKKNEHSK